MYTRFQKTLIIFFLFEIIEFEKFITKKYFFNLYYRNFVKNKFLNFNKYYVFNKTIDDIYNNRIFYFSYINIRKKIDDKINRNIFITNFENVKLYKNVVIFMSKKFRSKINNIIANELINITLYIELLIIST